MARTKITIERHPAAEPEMTRLKPTLCLWLLRRGNVRVRALCHRPRDRAPADPVINNGSSGIRVGQKDGSEAREPALGAGWSEVEPRRKPGMIAGCDPPDLSGVSPIRIGSLASAPCRRLLVSSVIPSGASSGS